MITTGKPMEYLHHFLYPAELTAVKKPHRVTTILGSCVAVCLWDPEMQIGGINHFMLPLWNGQGLASPRYGNFATEKLINKMEDLGAHKANLKAKLFGGAEVIIHQSNRLRIGERNVEIARQILREQNIPIISQSAGGHLGRKILFFTDTGKVLLKYIQKRNTNENAPK